MLSYLIWIFAGLGLVIFSLANRKAAKLAVASAPARMRARPIYHGSFAALLSLLSAVFVLLILNFAVPDESALRYVVLPISIAVAFLAFFKSYSLISVAFPARDHVEKIIRAGLLLCASVAVLTTIGIIASLVVEAFRFFQEVPVTEFLFGTHWSPQTALRADQQASAGAFGAIPLFAGTLLITMIAMAVAVPVGLFSAIYLAEFASDRSRKFIKPVLEVLAGVPTVVYGVFAALIIAPFFRDVGNFLGIKIASESALAAGVVMGIMIIPFVSSLSDDVIRAVPKSLKDSALGLGATRSEAILQVVLPAAIPGIVGSVLLAVSRAIGETMIVVMAAGLSANLSFNPFDAVTTVTVQIATLLQGDQSFDSAKTLSVFALGLVLFVATLFLNMYALWLSRRYRSSYL